MKTKCKHCNGTGEVYIDNMYVRKIAFKDRVFVLYPMASDEKNHELNEFIDYWTEANEGGVKMRFEMEKVYNLKRRLRTWFKNSRIWSPKQEPKLVSSIKLPH